MDTDCELFDDGGDSMCAGDRYAGLNDVNVCLLENRRCWYKYICELLFGKEIEGTGLDV